MSSSSSVSGTSPCHPARGEVRRLTPFFHVSPDALHQPIRDQIEAVKLLHNKDCAEGYGL